MRKAIKKAAADKKEKTIVRSYAEKKRLKQERAARFENVKHKNNTNFGSEGMKLKAEAKGPMEVRYRALAKKLRQIQELEAKKKEGASLDQWQLAKLTEETVRQGGDPGAGQGGRGRRRGGGGRLRGFRKRGRRGRGRGRG